VSEPRAVWQGRLAAPLDARAQALNDSLHIDQRLWPEELLLSRAYAETLGECGVLDRDGLAALLAACQSLGEDLAANRVRLEGEDVHSAIEAELTKRCGDPARRLHTGRSRNDQVSTLTRLRVMRLCDETVEELRALERSLIQQARGATQIAVAAYTHLQPAQPVLLAQLWLAHAHAFERDETRFEAAREAADRMPLGAGAVAGTPLRYDRVALAARLGFSRLAENSVDAVGDRDFALEYLNAAAVLGVHLSRLAEDLVIWCSPGFGWFRAPDGFSTGSSLLPQKRNPDLFELARGKAARLMANAQRLAIVMKGLPSAYQKDLQEDKEALFDTGDTLERLLAALPPAIQALQPNLERMKQSLTPDLLAVELADALVEKGVSFREAHAQVGQLWARAEQEGKDPTDLTQAQRTTISPHFTDDVLASLTVESALARRNQPPGAGPESVKQQLDRMESRLGLGAGDPEGMKKSNNTTHANPADKLDSTPPASAHTLPPSKMDSTAPGGPRAESLASDSRDGRRPGGPQPVSRSDVAAGAATERVAGERFGARAASNGVAPPSDPSVSEGASVSSTSGVVATPSDPSVSDGASVSSTINGIQLRRATLKDVPGIARIMASYVAQDILLPRPVGELFQCIREFHVAEANGEIVGCAALRLLWDDLGEVRSLAVRPDFHGRRLGAQLVAAVLADARALELPRVIALTREVPFFERCGFTVASRDRLPRKVWSDCVRCPKRHACDEIAVVLDLVPGASEAAEAAAGTWLLPIPQLARLETPALPLIS
jgi:argininosuccinate lyase